MHMQRRVVVAVKEKAEAVFGKDTRHAGGMKRADYAAATPVWQAFSPRKAASPALSKALQHDLSARPAALDQGLGLFEVLGADAAEVLREGCAQDVGIHEARHLV